MIFALVGNQNCGKTTLFNQLTGANQHVGNFPGVTVEQKIGALKRYKDCEVVDLPGLYSIRTYSNEEIVTRDFILKEKPDGIINVVDATNIERNLYLTLQLITLKIPTVLALNMMDEVKSNSGSIDVNKLSCMLGIPVVPISASKNEGVDDVVDAAISAVKNNLQPLHIDFCEYGPVHRCIHAVTHLIEDHADKVGVAKRFIATKLIEDADEYSEIIGLNSNERELLEHSIVEMERETGLDRNAVIADMRYSFIEKVRDECVVKPKKSKEQVRSAKIDKVLTSKYVAIPIFGLIMLAIFSVTFVFLGNYLAELIATGIEFLGEKTISLLTAVKLNPRIISFISEGVFEGVGSVLSLLPYILLLFLFLSLLEDSGYMARVAFIMDKPLRKIGLSGKSFVSIIIGFGCSVPAVMSTRTLNSERDKKLTLLLIPFISCSAKVIVYASIVSCGLFSAFEQVLIIAGLYILGIVLGILTMFIASKTLYKGNPVPFVMELPSYRLPSFKSVCLLIWEKTENFVKKAFSVIFIATLIIWFLKSYDITLNFVENSEQTSILSMIGNLFAPAFKPMTGENDGRIVASLIAGFTAKEAVISTLEMMGAEMSTIITTIPGIMGFLTFVLLYTPCIATVATLKKETGSTLKTAIMVLFQCELAYAVAVLIRYVFLLFC